MTWKIVAELKRLLAAESGSLVKDWGGKMPVGLAFPGTYHLAMSNLGFQAVYALFNGRRDVVCERFFLPPPRLAAEHSRTGTPLLSLESQRPAVDFELFAFSISFENDYPHLVRLLQMAGLAPQAAFRLETDPLVLAGGVTVRSNPEPLADFIDLALIGDGEIIIPSLVRAWGEARSSPLPKPDRVSFLARQVPGAYAPALYEAALDREGRLHSFQPKIKDIPEKIPVARASELLKPALAGPIITPETEFSDLRLVEIGRGCPKACRFCLAGYAYRPPRFGTLESILEALGPPLKPRERVGLVSPAVADHPQLKSLLDILAGQGREVSVSSLRLESLTPSIIQSLARGGIKSTALAPEAGSDRLRQYINKNLSQSQILEGVRLLAEAGWRKLKLYFMLGLPTETREDVQAVIDLTRKVKDVLIRQSRGRRLKPNITLTLASFVPKPHTPFQGQPMLDLLELKNRGRLIKDGLRMEKGVRIHFDPPKWAYLQTIFSRGDRRVGALIQDLAVEKYPLPQLLKRVNFNPDTFVYNSMERDKLLPWSFVDHGWRPGFLEEDLVRAAKKQATPSCQPETCRLCGICG